MIASAGISIRPQEGARSLAMAAMLGLAWGLAMILADVTIFHDAVPKLYTSVLVSRTTIERLTNSAVGVTLEEVLYRGLAFIALVAVLRRFASPEARWPYWLAIASVAMVIYPLFHQGYLAGLEDGALPILREFALHGTAGMAWGWLCWRHGWISGLTGHLVAHLAIDPLLALTV